MNRNGEIVRWICVGTAAGALLLFACGEDDPPADPDNHDPVIDSVSVVPDTTVREDTVLVTVTAHDPDGDSLRYNYNANRGTVLGSGSSVSWVAPDAVGGFSILASVTDGRSGVDSWSALLTVVDLATGIRGTAALSGGVGSLVGARLALYTDPGDWPGEPFYEETVPEDSPTAYSFTITPLPPGTYYLDVWQDVDDDGNVDTQDLYGFHGTGDLPNPDFTPIPVERNRMTNVGNLNIS